MATFLNGKFASFMQQGSTIAGAYKWAIGFKRDRLDTTNFTSDTDNVNVFSEGLTGVLDTTFSVDGYVASEVVNVFFPGNSVTFRLNYRRSDSLGYTGVADILDFSPNTAVRDKAAFTANFQTNGIVLPAM